MFPPEFAASVSAELLGSLDGEAVTSVRYNPFKLAAMPAPGGFLPTGDPVPWCRYGAYLSERPVFTLDPAWHAGAYYVQEASSMFVEHIFRSVIDEVLSSSPHPPRRDDANRFAGSGYGVRVLDLCAAPGGKTTLYSTLVGAQGLIVANEPVKSRASVLADNVRRWGVGNVAVTSGEPAAFGAYRHFFDVLAVDAPCSGEGMFRKDSNARREWSPSAVEMCAARQRRILAEGWDALRPGGVLIYSTCTFNRRENEDNVAWLLENFDAEPLPIDVPHEWGIITASAEASMFRFYPHLLRGEGFFAAALRKGDGRLRRDVPRARREVLTDASTAERRALEPWVAAPEAMRFFRAGENFYAAYRPHYQAIAALAGGLSVIYSGTCLGQLFGEKLRPDHALALGVNLADNKNFVRTPLDLDRAPDYLRKKEFADVSALAEGLNLLTCNDLPIGWTKRVGHRTNTLLPASFRIVNL